MKLTLRDYQQSLVDDINDALLTNNSVCAQLETGGGKSVVIGHLANSLPGRTLVLTHRVEILDQNSEWIEGVGILSAKKNTIGLSTRVVIAMVQTLHARLKRHGINYLGQFENIIIDEVHVDIFQKVVKQYKVQKIIGFTATPVTNKRKTVKVNGVEYVKRLTLSEQYDTIVSGPTINELIERGFLIQDFNISLRLPTFNLLRESLTQPDGYTNSSLDVVYNNRASIDILIEAVSKYCKGKKTLIFNSTTKNNGIVYNALLEQGYNVRMFDSVNNKASEREEIVDWFRDEREAILVGTNVFTTGFNVTDIEVVIVNRATKSLGLWLQMVGRGGRPTDIIFKDHFTVIDLGQNIEEHGVWSLDRNWEEHFEPQPLRLKRNVSLVETWTCDTCGSLNPVGETVNDKGEEFCSVCGAKRPPARRGGNSGRDKTGELVEREPRPVPTAKSIIDYTKRVGDNCSNFAFKILETQILGLFVDHSVTYKRYQRQRDGFQRRVRSIYIPIYFAIIRDDELVGASKRLETQVERMFNKIDKYYGIKE